MVSGTLGIDQIAIVAAEAAKRGVPYTAAGGDEQRPIPGMFQVAANYTTHVLQLAEFMAADPKLQGQAGRHPRRPTPQFIRPVADEFKARAGGQGQPGVDHRRQPEAGAEPRLQRLHPPVHAGTNTEVVVPLTDPLTTQQIVQRCAAGAACGWTYTFSNFAHDSDTALTLMAPTWSPAEGPRALGVPATTRRPRSTTRPSAPT